MNYKLGSLFDGSGGFPFAGALCGVEPVWAAEVEPYPIAVTKSHFPKMKHLGDISKINGGEIEPVDIITFGSPCQDLSVAGKRAGLKHEANGDEETTRSGLFMEAVRIIKEMRNATYGKYPSFALWENVPGAFSSNKGEDFRIVLEELIKIVEPSASMPQIPSRGWPYADSYVGDGWSIAYRVFDAQFWGVPQRRRRIHLVLDLRGQCAREVLFEREGVRGYFEKGGTPWQKIAENAERCPGADDSKGAGIKCFTPWDYQTRRCYSVNGVAPSLCAGADTSGQNQQSFCEPVNEEGRQPDAVGFLRQLSGVEAQQELSPTILAAAGESGNNKPCVAYAVDQGGGKSGANIYNDMAPTLCTTHGGEPAVAYTLKVRSGCAVDSAGKSAGKGALIQTDKAATLSTVQDQYLFQPVTDTHIIDNIGGQAEYGKASLVNGTLRAGCQGAVAYLMENHSADGRRETGGENIPMVMEPFCKSSRAKSADDATTWKHGKVANTLNTFDQGETRTNELVVCSKETNFIDVEMEVAVRKHEVNTEKLISVLRENKGSFTNKEIAEKLNRPVTMVEHWFRNDSSFAIPDPDIWPELKELLKIETTEFDQSILEFEYKGGNYDMRNRIHIADTAPTLTCGSGNTLHLVPKDPVICLQGNGIDRADTAGCNGKGWNDETCYTLNTIDRPAVAYGIDRAAYNQGQNAKYDFSVLEEQQPTMLAKGPVATCHSIGLSGEKRVSPTLIARMSSAVGTTQDALIVSDLAHYIVRRLTPTECARLQGFPDRWGDINSFDPNEWKFWEEVRNTYADINGKAVKEYTEKQIKTWYNKLHTDSAEYKMWGNGIALPPALYVLQGIVEAMIKGGNDNVRKS